MIPSFVKRLSARISGSQNSEDDTDAGTLSRKDTVELNDGAETSGKGKSLQKKRSSVGSISRSRSSSKTSLKAVELTSSLSKRTTLVLSNSESSIAEKLTATSEKRSIVVAATTTGLTPAKKLSKTSANKSISKTGKTSSVSKATKVLSKKSSIGDSAAKVLKKADSRMHVAASRKPEKRGNVELWFYRGEFVTVRASEDDGEFYIARLLQNAYNNSQEVKVRWVELRHDNKYVMTNHETIDPATIVMSVRVEEWHGSEYTLKKEDLDETRKILEIVTAKAAADDVEKLVDNGEVLKVEQIEPPAKKVRTGKKTAKASDEENKTIKADKEERKRKKKKMGKDDLTLTPRHHIKVLEKDPLFETRTKMPHISKLADSKLVFRAVILNDMKLLKTLVFPKTDKKLPMSLCEPRSVSNQVSAIFYAIKYNRKEMLQYMLLNFDISSNLTYSDQYSQVRSIGTGHYNPLSLGISAVRAVTVSRGVKEGNQALIKDINLRLEDKNDHETRFVYALQHGVTMETLNFLLEVNMDENYYDFPHEAIGRFELQHLVDGLEKGHRHILSKILKDGFKNSSKNEILLYSKILVAKTGEELKGQVPPSYIAQQLKQVGKLAAVHFAAVNPKTEVLEKVISVNPDFQMGDAMNRRPIHFAAACEGTGPLKYLIAKGASLYDADSKGQIPLHYAVRANRPNNVDVLLDAAEKETVADGDILVEKFGKGNINRPDKNSWQPLHVAAYEGNMDIIKKLVNHEAAVDGILNVKCMKLTPLMIACQEGHLNAVKCLIELGANPEKTDRLLRTPLIHAAMNGNANVVSYLLNIGVSVDRADSSNNTPLHYASAYGWYFCTHLLLEAGCKTNTMNDWKTTALSMTYMKGHFGIFHLILEKGEVDINFPDDQGQTLLFLAVKYPNSEDLVEQIQFLLSLKATTNLKDIFNKTPLYHLAEKKIASKAADKKGLEESMKISVQIAKLLVSFGCDQHVCQQNGWNALNAALAEGNAKLAAYLMEIGCMIQTEPDENGCNALHHVVQNLTYGSIDLVTPLINLLMNPPMKDGKKKEQMKERMKGMSKDVNKQGLTPLLYAANIYMEYNTRMNDLEYAWQGMKRLYSFFLDVCEVDVAVKTQKVKEQAENNITGDENDHYANSRGEWRVLDFVVSLKTSNEKQVKQIGHVVEILLEHDPELNYRTLDGTSPLFKACEQCNVHFAKQLLKGGPSNHADPKLSRLFVSNGKTYHIPLFISICKLPFHLDSEEIKKKIELCKVIHKHDSSVVNDKDEKENQYVLHQLFSLRKDASSNEFVLKVLELISKNVRCDLLNKDEQTAVHVAMKRCSGNFSEDLEIEFKLMSICQHELNLKDNLGRNALHYIFVKGENITNCSFELDPIDLCRKIFSYDGRLMFEEDNFGRTPLHYAAYRGSTMCCNFLIMRTSSSNIDLKDHQGNTPLALAVLGSHDHCATLLTQLKADIEIEVMQPDVKEEVPCWKWKPDRVSRSKPKPKKLFEAVLENEMNSMIFMLMDLPPQKSVHELLAVEMAINCKKYSFVLRLFTMMNRFNKLNEKLASNYDRTLLHVLALVDDVEEQEWQMFVVQKLMRERVLLSTKDEFKCTPLFYCLYRHKCRLAKYMIEMSPTPVSYTKTDGFGRTLLAASLWHYKGISSENKEMLTLLLDKTPIDKLFDLPVFIENFGFMVTDGRTYWDPATGLSVSPLIFAIINNDFQLAQLLLEKKADVNLPDSKKRTPLMYAVMMNNVTMVKLMLNHNYDPTKPPQIEETDKESGFGLKPVAMETDEQDDYFIDDDSLDDAIDAYMDGEDVGYDNAGEDGNTDGDKNEVEDEDEKYEYVDKTSLVDPEAYDEDGNNVLHYFVQGLESSKASFANKNLLFVLMKGGAENFDAKNKRGQTPLDLAFENNAVRAAIVMQELKDVPRNDMKIPDYEEVPIFDDGICFKNQKCDPTRFVEDAKKMVRREDGDDDDDEEDEEMIEDIIQPDISEYCQISDGKLVLDRDQSLLYSTLLTKVDINNTNQGIYNFYEMQLLHQPGKDLYILFTRWGRIGDRGMNQTTPFQSEEEGVKNFCSIFKSKTGNAWADIKNFKEQPNKYHLVDARWNKKPTKRSSIEIKLDYTAESELPSSLHDLMKQIMDSKARSFSVRNIYSPIDEDMFAFGKMDEKILKEAIEKLREIRATSKDIEEYKEDPTKVNADELKKMFTKLSQLNSEYYRMIPRKKYAFDHIHLLQENQEISREIADIKNLLNIETASKLLLGAMYNQTGVNPMDYVYQGLGVMIKQMDQDNFMAQYILASIRSATDNNVRVRSIYEVNRDGEEDALRSELGNRMFLWHGTNEGNLIGILHRGLVFNPVDTSSYHGQMYGEGIYFADLFQKSQSYASSSSETKLMILAEVALGKQFKIEPNKKVNRHVLNNYNSLFVRGRECPDPKGHIYLPSGVKMCVGRSKYDFTNEKGEYLSAYHNEYVVFNENQICIRYVIAYENVNL